MNRNIVFTDEVVYCKDGVIRLLQELKEISGPGELIKSGPSGYILKKIKDYKVGHYFKLDMTNDQIDQMVQHALGTVKLHSR